MPDIPAARKVFPVPPEVSAYFRDKSLKPGFSWLDVWGQEHAYAFTVAKAVDAELLGTFQKSLQKAIDEGQSFSTWRDQIRPELERQGYWGKRMVEDPTGKWAGKVVDFSNPRRLENIFWSNVRSARAAGQWERAQRSKKALPFFVYVHTTSLEPRVEHLAWVGIVLPVDHAFWETHFPPNGWNCKCSVRQITSREAARLLGQDGYTDDPGDFSRKVTYLNKRTGEVTQEPAGIDVGWGNNPGLSRAKTLVENLTAKLEQAGPEIATRVVQEWIASPAPKIMQGIEGSLRMPVAVAPALAEQLGAKSPIVVVGGAASRIAPEDFAKVQAAVDAGGAVERTGKAGEVSITHGRGDSLVRLAIAKTVEGYLAVKSLLTGADKTDRQKRPKDGRD